MKRLAIALALFATVARAQSTGSAGPSASQTAASNAVAVAGTTKSSNVPTAAGGSIMIQAPAQSDNCSLPISAGYGSLVLGATVVWSHADKGCEHIRQAYALNGLGYRAAAVQVMCELPNVKRAMK
ncbi:MAG: hypothetical protein ACYDD1_14085, partial [Caulobacteraceae bacterium]